MLGKNKNKKNKKNEIAKPHDITFKKLFSQKEIAKDVIEQNLPQEVLEILDMDSLEQIEGSFISKKLQETFSDIIYKVNLNNQESYIALLLEHKSSPDKLAVFQVAGYIIDLWTKIIAEGKKEIPVVIPIIIYHGRGNWNYKTDVRELIPDYNELPEYIKEKLPVLKHEFINIATHQEKEFKQYEPMTRMILKSMKYIFYTKEKLIEEFLISVEELPTDINDENLHYVIDILFIYYKNAINEITEEDIANKIRELGGKGEAIMTILQAREQKGRVEGMEIGMEKGMELGEMKKAKEVAKIGIIKGYDIKIIMDMSGLSQEEIEKIRKEIN